MQMSVHRIRNFLSVHRFYDYTSSQTVETYQANWDENFSKIRPKETGRSIGLLL